MQHTPHLRLPLFESADKPTWLYDWNETMTILDDTIFNISSEDMPPEVAAMLARIEALERTVAEHTTSIDELQDDITDILADITALQTDINRINSLIPNTATPTNQLATMADVGGGSGGGHVIQNAAGQDLTQRDTMQFVGGLSASDDPSGQKTVVSDVYEEIPYSTWSAYTEQEKAQHPNAIITDVPDEEGGSYSITELFSTPVTFGVNDTLSLSDDYDKYDALVIETAYREQDDTSTAYYCQFNSVTLPKPLLDESYYEGQLYGKYRGWVNFLASCGQATQYYMNWVFKLTNKYTLSCTGKTTGSWNPGQCYIYRIYGIKYGAGSGSGSGSGSGGDGGYDITTGEFETDIKYKGKKVYGMLYEGKITNNKFYLQKPISTEMLTWDGLVIWGGEHYKMTGTYTGAYNVNVGATVMYNGSTFTITCGSSISSGDYRFICYYTKD